MATNNINLGKVLITPQGGWNAEKIYQSLDLVYTLDGSYIAKKENQNIPVTDTTVWQQVAGRGPAGTGNVSVVENGLQTGKKYLFVPSANNSAEGQFEEYIPESFSQQQADWTQTQTSAPDFIKNKPSLFSGDYNDLHNKPVLFNGNYNDLQNKPSIPGNTSDLHNDAGFISVAEVEENYQSKEQGKGLSSNDYTTIEKNKLNGIEEGAQKNTVSIHKTVQLDSSSWEQTEGNWSVTISDPDIINGCFVIIKTNAKTNIHPIPGFNNGSIILYAGSEPVSMTIEYDIVGWGGKQTSGLVISYMPNELAEDQFALLNFMLKSNTVTSLANIPFDGQIIYANINSNQSLSIDSTAVPVPGQSVHLFILNTTASARTITIPNTGNCISMSGTSITLPGNGRIEIDIVYDTNESKYKIVVLEV